MTALVQKMRNATILAVVVIVAYGIIQIGDDDDEPKVKETGEDKVSMALQVEVAGSPDIDSIEVAISADLGSAGHYIEKRKKIYNGLKYQDGSRDHYHKFRVRRGETVSASAVPLGNPITLILCSFYQEGQNLGPNNVLESMVLPGYGDITKFHRNGTQLQEARCTATAR